MAYTNVWNSASPPGSQDAKTADDEFRKFRLDIEERMEDKFITDVVVDPWVVKPEILGNVTGKVLMISHTLFVPDANTVAHSRLDGRTVNTNPSAANFFCALIMPVGITVTDVSYLVERLSGVNIACSFVSGDFTTTPGTTVHATVSTTVGGISIVTSSGLTVVTTNVRTYHLKVNLSNNDRIYGAKVIYNTADCRVTL